MPIVSIQNQCNITHRESEAALNYCEKEKMGFAAGLGPRMRRPCHRAIALTTKKLTEHETDPERGKGRLGRLLVAMQRWGCRSARDDLNHDGSIKVFIGSFTLRFLRMERSVCASQAHS